MVNAPSPQCQPNQEPLRQDAPTAQEFAAWADEAQACIDSGDVIISDHRKANATVVALRSHATLTARNRDLEARVEELTKGLQQVRRYAKCLKNSHNLIGPAEYADDPRAIKIWQRAVYHEGKTIEGMVKAAQHGSEIFEPEKPACAALLPSTPAVSR